MISDDINSANNPTRQKKTKSRHRKLTYILVGAILIFIAFMVYVISGLPSLEELENPKPALASKVYSIDGELIGQFFIENRIESNIDSVPKVLIDALIATEDRKFYDHWGVDIDRLLKAIAKNVFTFSREGASTITQQLSKNLYNLKSHGENSFETFVRKMREWISSIQIEKNFTKKEILELYLNVSYFGKGAYGVESAANIYFDKKAKDLNVTESALLVALLKSSVNYDPEFKYDNALRRRNIVLMNLVNTGKLEESEYNKLKEEGIVLARGQKVKSRSEATHFLEHIRQQMIEMADRYGYDLYRDGLTIYTTLDMRMQRIANKVAAAHLKEYQEIFDKNWKWESNQGTLRALIDKAIKSNPEYREAEDKAAKDRIYNRLKNNKSFIDSVKKVESTVQTGFVVADVKTGQIRALVGGNDQKFMYGLNHVTQIRRQPGSSFKPIVYTVAIDNGYYPAYSLLNQKFNYNGWSPNNSDYSEGGYMTLRRGLALSVNIIAAKLTVSDMAPPSQVVKFAKRMGINSQLPAFPSIALGTAELSPLELNSAYQTIANHGIYISPITILKIEDRNGMMIDEFKPEYREAISPQTASIITNMMQDVLAYGTGARVREFFHRPAAGKTGTTQDFGDAWFVGFTPQLVGTVWTGFDDGRVKFNGWYGQGARASMPIWAKFMEGAYKQLNIPLEYFKLDEDVESVRFCKYSIDMGDAKLATGGCIETISDLINKKKKPGYCTFHGGGATHEDRTGSEW
ncbi:MAG: penicillin-binding protein 1A [Ignavibacteriaceae bacterium]